MACLSYTPGLVDYGGKLSSRDQLLEILKNYIEKVLLLSQDLNTE